MFITPILVGTTLLAFGDIKIEEILPTETVFACSVKDINHVADSIADKEQREKIHNLISKVFDKGKGKEICSAVSESFREVLAKAGIDEDWDPQIPSGYAGFGVYPVPDFELGTISIAMLGVVEISGTKWGEVADALIESMVEEMDLDAETVDIGGEEVWMIGSWLNQDFLDEAPMDLGKALSIDRIYLVESGGYFICGTDPDGIDRAIAAVMGSVEDSSLATNETYETMMGQVSDGDLKAVVMFDNLADAIIQADQTHMIGMFLPILKSAIGDVDGFAETVNLAPSEEVFLDASYTLWMPNGRTGLLGLASEVATKGETPNFVGENTISYSQFTVDFEKISPWFRGLMAMNPMMPIPPEQLDAMEVAVSAAVAPLGNTVHAVSSLALPISEQSMGFLMAIECNDSEAMETYLSTMMPMTGSEPQDFLGYRLYPIELPTGAMMMGGGMNFSLSLAVGGNWVMFGLSHSVEEALRCVANPQSAKETEIISSATSYISKDGATGWGYADLGESLLAGSELSNMTLDKMIEEMETFDPEMAEEMREEFAAQREVSNSINEVLAMLLGPTAWTMQANDQGFVAHAVLMRP